VSSLAFVAAALPISRAARRRGAGAWRWVARASALEGIGSAAYHGPGDRASKGLHDIGLVLLAGAVGMALVQEGRALPRRPVTAALGSGALVLHRLSRTGGPLCACRSPLQGHAVFHLLAAAALVTAAQGR
jgi:hypothetical protein